MAHSEVVPDSAEGDFVKREPVSHLIYFILSRLLETSAMPCWRCSWSQRDQRWKLVPSSCCAHSPLQHLCSDCILGIFADIGTSSNAVLRAGREMCSQLHSKEPVTAFLQAIQTHSLAPPVKLMVPSAALKCFLTSSATLPSIIVALRGTAIIKANNFRGVM